MAIIINSEKGVFNLPNDFKVEIEITSPIYNEKGSRTIGSTLPGTKHNLSLVDHINRMDIANTPDRKRMVTITDGVYRRTGKMNITTPATSGIVCNIGFDESLMYEAWSNIQLKKIPDLPVYRPRGGISELMDHLDNVWRYAETADYYVFPVQVGKDENDGVVYPEVLNPIIKTKDKEGISPPVYQMVRESRMEQIILSGKVTSVKVPAGYGMSPFLKVSKILELIFSAYGYKIIENPFLTDYQLKKMVVLNNVADTIVEGYIDYKDLMPDCTINDFLDSLFCRTGAQIFVNGNNKTARICLLKDSLRAAPVDDWTMLRASEIKPIYSTPKQLKISAATSFEGAAPANDNFEDFYNKYSGVFANFLNSDINNVPSEYHMIFQMVTGNYYKNSLIAGNPEWVSSDFFPWDKKVTDMEYEEIIGKDECVPMGYNQFVLCPQYLAGYTHYHTTLQRAKTAEKEENKETPLAFCFAMGMGQTSILRPGQNPTPTYSGYYYGSTMNLNLNGEPFKDTAGNPYNYSLIFCGEYGAFNQFFKEWDAVLRHANHMYEGEINLDKSRLSKLDTSKPVLISGQKLLIENVKHSLPTSKDNPATVKLRSLKLLQPYNLEKEQELLRTIPQSTKWIVISYFDEILDARIKVLQDKYKTNPRLAKTSKEKITQPSDEDFASFLPPSETDVKNKKEIMNVYKAKLYYTLDHYHVVNGRYDYSTKWDEEIEYKAGVKAVYMNS